MQFKLSKSSAAPYSQDVAQQRVALKHELRRLAAQGVESPWLNFMLAVLKQWPEWDGEKWSWDELTAASIALILKGVLDV